MAGLGGFKDFKTLRRRLLRQNKGGPRVKIQLGGASATGRWRPTPFGFPHTLKTLTQWLLSRNGVVTRTRHREQSETALGLQRPTGISAHGNGRLSLPGGLPPSTTHGRLGSSGCRHAGPVCWSCEVRRAVSPATSHTACHPGEALDGRSARARQWQQKHHRQRMTRRSAFLSITGDGGAPDRQEENGGDRRAETTTCPGGNRSTLISPFPSLSGYKCPH